MVAVASRTATDPVAARTVTVARSSSAATSRSWWTLDWVSSSWT